MIIHLDDFDKFKNLLSKPNKLIIDFFATWCGPCKMLSPMLEQVSKNYPDWVILEIDIDKFPQLAQAYNVQAVPTLVFIVEKQIKDMSVGFKSYNDLEKIIKKLL